MLARYKIVRELGRGAMGAVYAARDRETGEVVALKRLDPALLSKSDPNFAGRVVKHARSARHLKHRNIVKVHDAGEAGGTVYVAMEMLEGRSLRNLLDEGPLSIARAIQIAHDIACGLAHAHLEGVVHGGLKPSNVIVSRSGVVKITDFGIGQLGQLGQAALSGAPAGSLKYMSPEQVRGDALDHRCDIFALGALFYEMLTHRPPPEGEPPPPSEVNPLVPRALDATVLSMLAAQPGARMPGAPILLRDLQRLEEGLGVGSGASAGSDEPVPGAPPSGPEASPRKREPDRPRTRAPMQEAEEFEHRDRTTDRETFDYQRAMLMMERESRRERSYGWRPGVFATLVLVLAVLGIGVAGFVYYSSDASQRDIAASRIRELLAAAIATSRPTAPSPAAEATEEAAAVSDAPQVPLRPAASDGQAGQESSGSLSAPNPIPPKSPAEEPGPLAQTESSLGPASEEPASVGAAPAQDPPPATQPTAKVPQQQPGGTAQLIVAVSPRGEVYIDGKHHGTTPPITTFDLEPGMHRIEVRSGSRTPYLTYMTVQAGDVRRIRHSFDATRAVRPPKSASWQSSNRPAR